jgi:hypothetical protein
MESNSGTMPSQEPLLEGIGLLKNYAAWWPDVPSYQLDLNERYMSHKLSFDYRDYRPLVWTHFGGNKGQLLRQLIRVEGFVADLGYDCLFQIRFHYHDKATNSSDMEIWGWEHWKYQDFHIKLVVFDIDGPGGEYLTGIDLLYEPWPNFLSFPASKVFTPDEDSDVTEDEDSDGSPDEIPGADLHDDEDQTEDKGKGRPSLESMRFNAIQVRTSYVLLSG